MKSLIVLLSSLLTLNTIAQTTGPGGKEVGNSSHVSVCFKTQAIRDAVQIAIQKEKQKSSQFRRDPLDPFWNKIASVRLLDLDEAVSNSFGSTWTPIDDNKNYKEILTERLDLLLSKTAFAWQLQDASNELKKHWYPVDGSIDYLDNHKSPTSSKPDCLILNLAYQEYQVNQTPDGKISKLVAVVYSTKLLAMLPPVHQAAAMIHEAYQYLLHDYLVEDDSSPARNGTRIVMSKQLAEMSGSDVIDYIFAGFSATAIENIKNGPWAPVEQLSLNGTAIKAFGKPVEAGEFKDRANPKSVVPYYAIRLAQPSLEFKINGELVQHLPLENEIDPTKPKNYFIYVFGDGSPVTVHTKSTLTKNGLVLRGFSDDGFRPPSFSFYPGNRLKGGIVDKEFSWNGVLLTPGMAVTFNLKGEIEVIVFSRTEVFRVGPFDCTNGVLSVQPNGQLSRCRTKEGDVSFDRIMKQYVLRNYSTSGENSAFAWNAINVIGFATADGKLKVLMPTLLRKSTETSNFISAKFINKDQSPSVPFGIKSVSFASDGSVQKFDLAEHSLALSFVTLVDGSSPEERIYYQQINGIPVAMRESRASDDADELAPQFYLHSNGQLKEFTLAYTTQIGKTQCRGYADDYSSTKGVWQRRNTKNRVTLDEDGNLVSCSK